MKTIKCASFFILIFILTLLPLHAQELTLINIPETGFRAVPGEVTKISAYDACTEIHNNAEYDLFIPTSSLEEWNDFYTKGTTGTLSLTDISITQGTDANTDGKCDCVPCTYEIEPNIPPNQYTTMRLCFLQSSLSTGVIGYVDGNPYFMIWDKTALWAILGFFTSNTPMVFQLFEMQGATEVPICPPHTYRPLGT
ncbi:MAG: hypothetical protein KAJ18_06505 [Candidatus Omnitrophica bacterium]|nr:hypothetical protein [Candidatus Omnitrophota bacterium]